jgi:predicted phage terminase large subunit-like protein
LNYPELRHRICENWLKWGAEEPAIVEDKGSGISLVQDLRGDEFAGFPRAIVFKPLGDKLSRMHARPAKIEAGHVLVPKQADWLDE